MCGTHSLYDAGRHDDLFPSVGAGAPLKGEATFSITGKCCACPCGHTKDVHIPFFRKWQAFFPSRKKFSHDEKRHASLSENRPDIETEKPAWRRRLPQKVLPSTSKATPSQLLNGEDIVLRTFRPVLCTFQRDGRPRGSVPRRSPSFRTATTPSRPSELSAEILFRTGRRTDRSFVPL